MHRWPRTALVGACAVSQQLPSSQLSPTTTAFAPSVDRARLRSSCDATATRLLATSSSNSLAAITTGNTTSSSLSSLPPLSSLERYHLLSSPHALTKTFGTAAVIAVLPPSLHFINLPNLIKRIPFPAIMGNVVLPLAASSCCLLQLGLNLLSVGCAGWNSFLGPVRPYLLGVLLHATVRHTATISPISLAWRSVVALSPEIVFVYNTWRQRHPHQPQRNQPQQRYEVQFDVPSMGCVACINSIDRNLAKVPGVLHVQSELHAEKKGGSTTLVVATNADSEDPNGLTEQIIATLARSGFDHAVLTRMRGVGES